MYFLWKTYLTQCRMKISWIRIIPSSFSTAASMRRRTSGLSSFGLFPRSPLFSTSKLSLPYFLIILFPVFHFIPDFDAAFFTEKLLHIIWQFLFFHRSNLIFSTSSSNSASRNGRVRRTWITTTHVIYIYVPYKPISQNISEMGVSAYTRIKKSAFFWLEKLK